MRDTGDVTGVPTADATQSPSQRVDEGFPRARRIVRNADYQRIFSNGRRRAGRFQVLWVGSGKAVEPRVGVIASKRTFRRAVDRARAKRLLREAFRLNREKFERDTDCVLVARRAILNAGRRDVEQDLLALARRCHVIRRAGRGGEQ